MKSGSAPGITGHSPWPCFSSPSPACLPRQQKLPPAPLDRAKSTADALMNTRSGSFSLTLDAEGPAGAVRICADVAQERTARHAREGIYVRRVSQKIRNQANRPDEVEQLENWETCKPCISKKASASWVELRAEPGWNPLAPLPAPDCGDGKMPGLPWDPRSNPSSGSGNSCPALSRRPGGRLSGRQISAGQYR